VATEELPPETEASATCPECGTELIITSITPVLFVGEFEYLTLACKTCGFTKEIKVKHS
jgi:C4-type Zn-finger protein